MKVWIATWSDSGSDQTETIGVYDSKTKAEDGIVEFDMDDEDCYVEEWEVQ